MLHELVGIENNLLQLKGQDLGDKRAPKNVQPFPQPLFFIHSQQQY